MIRPGLPADLAAVTSVFRSASLSNAGDRELLLAHPGYLVMGPEALAEGRTYVAEENGSVVGFASWAPGTDGAAPTDAAAGAERVVELEDLFVDPAWMRRGIATALVSHIVEVLRANRARRLEVTANPHALAFYRAAGFTDCGVSETAAGGAPRMKLMLR